MDDESITPLLTERSSGTGFIKACFNVTNAFLGIGLLTVPYAIASGGWLSLVLLLLVSIMTFYTAVFLTRCMDTDPSIRSVHDIGERAFGRAGRITVLIVMNCELYLICIGLIVMEADNLHKLFAEFVIDIGSLVVIDGRRSFVIVTGLLILPTMLFIDLGYLSYVSATGVFSCLIIFVSVVCVGFFDGVGFGSTGSLLSLSGLPTAVSLYIVCFAGHMMVPSIYTSMKFPHKFSKVLFVSFSITALTYLSMAIVAYLMYGDNIESPITLNMSTSSIAGSIAIYTTLLIPIAKYALVMTPIANAIDVRLSEHQNYRDFHKRSIRVGLLLSTMICAFVFPHFESLMSILGSIFVVLASFVLPCLCYLKISGSYRRWSVKSVSIVFIVVFGIVAGVLGTYTSIVELV